MSKTLAQGKRYTAAVKDLTSLIMESQMISETVAGRLENWMRAREAITAWMEDCFVGRGWAVHYLVNGMGVGVRWGGYSCHIQMVRWVSAWFIWSNGDRLRVIKQLWPVKVVMTGVNVIASGLINRQPHSVGLAHEDLDVFGYIEYIQKYLCWLATVGWHLWLYRWLFWSNWDAANGWLPGMPGMAPQLLVPEEH